LQSYNGGMPEQPTSRRQFLAGQSAAEALSGVGEQILPEGAEPSRRAAMLTLSRRAMACEFQVRLNASADQNETAAAMAALDAIERIEDRLTVYRDESEVIAINRRAAEGPVEVDPDILHLLNLAAQLHDETAGAFDITSGPLSDAWGFSRRAGRLPRQDAIDAALDRVGGSRIQLDTSASTVAFDGEGVEINFNSIGKGFALDVAAGVLLEHNVDDFLLHGGRSTLVARGKPAEGAGGEHGWAVGVRDPVRPHQRIAECRLRDAAFSTSGSATQCFVVDGKRYGHLIDPRTGWPASGLHSVSVVAPTGAEADAISTALYVMGFEAGEAFCRRRPEVQALFVLPAGGGAVDVRGVQLDSECWRLRGGA
ncbi:MAG: FAD:protein FMN transferase, partial [Planctomycetota bacterium]